MHFLQLSNRKKAIGQITDAPAVMECATSTMCNEMQNGTRVQNGGLAAQQEGFLPRFLQI